jgi:basic membrane lipoprotein Med (substrate-binding protein (PBP1-ABC) superfamily)
MTNIENTPPNQRLQALRLGTVILLAALIAAALLLVLAPVQPVRAQPTAVGLVTDGPTEEDGGFNWLSYQGLERAQSDLGVVGTVYTSTDSADYGPNLQQCVDEGNDLCISVGFGMAEATLTSAQANASTDFAIVDVSWDAYPGNLRGMTFAADEAGYLAGTLAGLMTESDIVGDIGGMPIPAVDEFVYGYRNGAQCANPDVSVLISYTWDFMDMNLGGQMALDMMAEGADVIFAAAGPAGWGAILSATQSLTPAWGIGVDTDNYHTVFLSGTVPGSDMLLSSALKRIDNAVYTTIAEVVDGTFISGTVRYDLAVDGVGLAPFHEADPSVPQNVRNALDQASQGIIDGSIDVNDPCEAAWRCYLPIIVSGALP